MSKIFKKGGLPYYALATIVIIAVASASVFVMWIVVPAAIRGEVTSLSDILTIYETPLTVEEETALEKTYPMTATVAFHVKNILGGALWATGRVLLYNVGDYTSALETITIDGSGDGTSGDKYHTGDTYMLQVFDGSAVDSATEKMWYEWEVPGGGSLLSTTIYAPIVCFEKGTYVLTVTDTEGTSYADAGSWNITSGGDPGLGTSTTDYTVNIRNSADNTGFYSTYDPIWEIQYNLVLAVQFSGGAWEDIEFAGSGCDIVGKSSSNTYYVELDETLTRRTTVGDVATGGKQSVDFRIKMPATCADVTNLVEIQEFTSNDYILRHNGAFGTPAYDLAVDITITITD